MKKEKIIILFLLIIIFILLVLVSKDTNIEEENETTIEEEIEEMKEVPVIEEIFEEEKIEIIIEDFVQYKFHPRTFSKSLNKLKFNSSFFGIEDLKSNIDFDEDGIDDYTDIVEGARTYVLTNPTYKSDYYAGGYPPPTEGVCTDVVWNALQAAGYNLKDMVDEDIKYNKKEYPYVEVIDPNIDFRRVKNLYVFFKRHTKSLTLDTSKIEEWQGGDIIVYSYGHIGVVSNMRNYKGVPYLIHHGGSTPAGEYNTLDNKFIQGHFRIVF